jgi:hypothetical protein
MCAILPRMPNLLNPVEVYDEIVNISIYARVETCRFWACLTPDPVLDLLFGIEEPI